MLSPSVVLALATYLTESKRVVKASIGLEIGGHSKAEAEAFFALRKAFGIEGYMQSDDALAAIEKATGSELSDEQPAASPSTAAVAAAFAVLEPLGVTRWDTETALKAAQQA